MQDVLRDRQEDRRRRGLRGRRRSRAPPFRARRVVFRIRRLELQRRSRAARATDDAWSGCFGVDVDRCGQGRHMGHCGTVSVQCVPQRCAAIPRRLRAVDALIVRSLAASSRLVRAQKSIRPTTATKPVRPTVRVVTTSWRRCYPQEEKTKSQQQTWRRRHITPSRTDKSPGSALERCLEQRPQLAREVVAT